MKASEHGGNVPPSIGNVGYSKSDDDVWCNSTTSEQDAIESLAEEDESGLQGDGDDLIGYIADLTEPSVPKIDMDDTLFALNEQMSSDVSDEVVGDWPSQTPEQLAELNDEINAVFAKWLTHHKLWPMWCDIDNIRPVLRKQVSPKP